MPGKKHRNQYSQKVPHLWEMPKNVVAAVLWLFAVERAVTKGVPPGPKAEAEAARQIVECWRSLWASGVLPPKQKLPFVFRTRSEAAKISWQTRRQNQKNK